MPSRQQSDEQGEVRIGPYGRELLKLWELLQQADDDFFDYYSQGPPEPATAQVWKLLDSLCADEGYHSIKHAYMEGDFEKVLESAMEAGRGLDHLGEVQFALQDVAMRVLRWDEPTYNDDRYQYTTINPQNFMNWPLEGNAVAMKLLNEIRSNWGYKNWRVAYYAGAIPDIITEAIEAAEQLGL